MFKILVFLSLFQLSTIGFVSAAAIVDCPGVTNVQKIGQTGSSLNYSWSGTASAVQYKVWYVRQEDGYFSGYFYVTSTSYNFTGLSKGHYTLYFQAVCTEQSSDFIGLEDVIGV